MRQFSALQKLKLGTSFRFYQFNNVIADDDEYEEN